MFDIFDPSTESYEFDLRDEDLTDLVLHPTANESLYVFRNRRTGSLVKHFVLDVQPQVMTAVTVNLVRKAGVLQPNVTFRKHLKGVEDGHTLDEPVGDDVVRKVKAQVTLTNQTQRENFWRLIHFLESFVTKDAPSAPLHVVGGDKADLIRALGGVDRATILETVTAVMGGRLNVEDIAILTGRKTELEIFGRMLSDPHFFEAEMTSHGEAGQRDGKERTWQKFFERNHWIFGYGLVLVAAEALDGTRLEQTVVGATAFASGKRVDALMRTKGVVGGLLFAEIKTHTTDLLGARPYRAEDVFRPSAELVGAIAQVQKTAAKTIGLMAPTNNRAQGITGEWAAVRPRQVVVIGHLDQVKEDGERYSSFEMFRRSLTDVEVLTFDELYERALFILTTQQ